MPKGNRVLAWVELRCGGFLAAFVGGGALDRGPATRVCPSPEAAREWVEDEAAALSVPVEWVPADQIRGRT
jgi:hypothetical protein